MFIELPASLEAALQKARRENSNGGADCYPGLIDFVALRNAVAKAIAGKEGRGEMSALDAIEEARTRWGSDAFVEERVTRGGRRCFVGFHRGAYFDREDPREKEQRGCGATFEEAFAQPDAKRVRCDDGGGA